MEDLEKQLLDVVARMGIVRSLRAVQFRQLHQRQEQGLDASELEMQLKMSAEAMHQLKLERKKLAAELKKIRP